MYGQAITRSVRTEVLSDWRMPRLLHWSCRRVHSNKRQKVGKLFMMSGQENAIGPHDSQSGSCTETVKVPQGISRVSCDGGGGTLGHPVIWLTLAEQPTSDTLAVCPYCSRRFVGK